MAVNSLNLARSGYHSAHAGEVMSAEKVTGFCIHFARSAETITEAESIQNHFLRTTNLLKMPSFGNKSARGRTSITNTTAYQLKSKSLV
jgi:hypothetical protein